MGGFGCACHGVGVVIVCCLNALLQFEGVSELFDCNGQVVVVQFEAKCNGFVEVREEEVQLWHCGGNVSQPASQGFDILEVECLLVGAPGVTKDLDNVGKNLRWFLNVHAVGVDNLAKDLSTVADDHFFELFE